MLYNNAVYHHTYINALVTCLPVSCCFQCTTCVDTCCAMYPVVPVVPVYGPKMRASRNRISNTPYIHPDESYTYLDVRLCGGPGRVTRQYNISDMYRVHAGTTLYESEHR